MEDGWRPRRRRFLAVAYGTRRVCGTRQPSPAPVVYASAPPPVVHDPAYRLDAGDRLRIVVYGQEGLTNTYLVGAGGSITMPLIGAVTARGRTPAELSAASPRGCATVTSASLTSPQRSRPTGRSSFLARSRPRPVSVRAEHDGRKRRRHRRRLFPRAKRDLVTVTHTDARGTVRIASPRHAAQPRRHRPCRRTLVLRHDAVARSTASHPSCRSCAGWRHHPAYPRCRERTGRSRPSRRHCRRQPHRRRARGCGFRGDRPANETRYPPYSDPPGPPPSDLFAWMRFAALIRKLRPDVLHGHGAKAGTFVRLKGASKDTIRIDTPHGGSLDFR